MKTLLTVLSIWLSLPGLAAAHGGHQGKIPDLKSAPASHHVAAAGYCKGVYRLRFGDGSTIDFTEFNLRIKTDSGPNGPRPGEPVQVASGMRGDRAFLIFSHPGEISNFLMNTC